MNKPLMSIPLPISEDEGVKLWPMSCARWRRAVERGVWDFAALVTWLHLIHSPTKLVQGKAIQQACLKVLPPPQQDVKLLSGYHSQLPRRIDSNASEKVCDRRKRRFLVTAHRLCMEAGPPSSALKPNAGEIRFFARNCGVGGSRSSHSILYAAAYPLVNEIIFGGKVG